MKKKVPVKKAPIKGARIHRRNQARIPLPKHRPMRIPNKKKEDWKIRLDEEWKEFVRDFMMGNEARRINKTGG